MQLVRGLHNRALLNTPAVATIGSFDAIHIGHQALLARLCAVAKQDNCASTVILFEPQPREFFQPDHAPARVLRLRDKISILRTLGVDQVWCLRFNHALAALSAEEFVQIVLVDVLQTKHLIIGDDFRFGAGRKPLVKPAVLPLQTAQHVSFKAGVSVVPGCVRQLLQVILPWSIH